jgi:hypothetical protein
MRYFFHISDISDGSKLFQTMREATCRVLSQGKARRGPAASQRHHPGNGGARERHLCAGATANGRKFDPYRETARMALEPWLVEAALVRLGRILSPADQRTIVNATRTLCVPKS